MQLCEEHFRELRGALVDRGLWSLVRNKSNPSALDAKGKTMHRELVRPQNPSGFDPLQAAIWGLYGRAVEMGGAYLLIEGGCPVCRQREFCRTPQDWVNNNSDIVLRYCREQKLVKTRAPKSLDGK